MPGGNGNENTTSSITITPSQRACTEVDDDKMTTLLHSQTSLMYRRLLPSSLPKGPRALGAKASAFEVPVIHVSLAKAVRGLRPGSAILP